MAVPQFMRFVFFAVPIFKHGNLRSSGHLDLHSHKQQMTANLRQIDQFLPRQAIELLIFHIDDTIHWQLISIRSCVSSQIDLPAIRTTHAANTCEGEW